MLFKRLLFVCVLIVLSSQLIAQSAGQQAYQAQDRGQYQQAIQQYDSLLQAGWQSADLHFNLANAYYQNRDFGRAMLHSEKAFRLAPYDRQIKANLSYLRNEQADELPPLPTFFLKAWAQSLAARLGANTWAILAIVLGVIAVLAFIARFRQWLSNYRKWMPLASIVAFLLSVLCIALGLTRQHALAQSDQAVLLQPEAVLQVAPDEASDDVFTIHAGLRARVLDVFEGWTKLQLVDGREGWIPSEAVGII